MNFIALNVIFHNYEKFSDNTLLFSPLKVKIENFDSNMSEALPEATIKK
ncbi:MAG: hypothetical protein IPL84_00090 [Chitinophagaceae bacterium]|nr:hypothetical protein [Chitinophagaceae bacterium]